MVVSENSFSDCVCPRRPARLGNELAALLNFTLHNRSSISEAKDTLNLPVCVYILCNIKVV